jgi:hypothetical protein
MKTKEINFERVRVEKPESSCEPSVGSAGGMEFGGDVQAPGLLAGTRGQGSQVSQGFAFGRESDVELSHPAGLAQSFGLHLGQTDQRQVFQLLGQSPLPASD